MTISNPSFETAATQSGVDVESLPASWDKSAAASGLDAATFGPPYEWADTFGALWDGNEDAYSEFIPGTHLSDANFGVSPQQTIYDSFETQWPDNEDAYSEFEPATHLVAAVFGSTAQAYEAFDTEWNSRHDVADTTRWITDTMIDATPANVWARLNELKGDHNPHIADATVHTSADSTNVIAAADATDLPSSVALADELWEDCWSHILDTGLAWHRADFLHPIVKTDDSPMYPAASYGDCSSIANYLTVYCDLHFTWSDNSGPGYFTAFDSGATNIFAYPMDAIMAGPITADSFEGGWDGNHNAYSEFIPVTHLSDADFTTDGAPNAYESFETELTLQALAAPGYGTPLDIDSTSGVRVTISGTFSATLILQVRRPGSTTWLDWDTTTAPGDMDVDAGYVAVRMYTFAYTSGTPAAKLKWRPIETL